MFKKMVFVVGSLFVAAVVQGKVLPASEKDLKEFYRANCAVCHGADGAAVSAEGKRLKGENFTDEKWQKETPDKAMVKAILNGIFFGLAMPSYKGKLTPEEAQKMVTEVIRSSKRGVPILPNLKVVFPEK